MRNSLAYLLLLFAAFTLPGCRSKIGFPPGFSHDLQEKLRYALDTFKPGNHAFILDVKTNTDVILQIVHRSYAEQTRHENDRFGFALQVTFPANVRDARAYEKFKTSPLSSGFIAYKYEGTPCYVIDLGEDIVKTQELTEKLLMEVYELQDIQHLTAKLSDEGAVAEWIRE